MSHQPNRRADATDVAPYYLNYVNRVKTTDVVEALRHQIDDSLRALRDLPTERWSYAYAPGKWTIRQKYQHVIDTERMMTARALRIARGDQTPIPGFDQNLYAASEHSASRSPESLIEEWVVVRRGTVLFFDHLQHDAWNRQGTASDVPVTVLGLAYIIAGHELHHLELLKERYIGR